MLDHRDAERPERKGRAQRRKMAQALAARARIVLRATAGPRDAVVASELGTARRTTGTRRERFAQLRTDGLRDEPRPGGRVSLDRGGLLPREQPERGVLASAAATLS